ncbi:hypothetical protein B7494_g6904 [Chlorociboria aeruginascens]|nr:hypothetical protein B7494_g6904 [Chlorociboria aeruginascens]
MQIPPLFLLAFILLPPRILGCLRYAGTFPWDTSLPFLATITDNGIITCSINETYDRHMIMQSTTDVQADGTWYFKPWTFTCVNSSFEARAEIGVRIVWYKAYEKDWRFIVDEVENIAAEKWEHKRSLWCPKDMS